MKKIACAALSFLMFAPLASALDVGTSQFRYLSELTAAGFTPFATSGIGNTLFGMQRGSDMFLCFLADTPEMQQDRQDVLLDEILHDGAEARDVPNIPVICVLTQ